MEAFFGLGKAIDDGLHIKICAKPFDKDYMVLVENDAKRTISYVENKNLSAALAACSKDYFEEYACADVGEVADNQEQAWQLNSLAEIIKKGSSVSLNKVKSPKQNEPDQKSEINLTLHRAGNVLIDISGKSILEVLSQADSEAELLLTHKKLAPPAGYALTSFN